MHKVLAAVLLVTLSVLVFCETAAGVAATPPGSRRSGVGSVKVAAPNVLAARSSGALPGNYVFAGGTSADRLAVTSALRASAFDWRLVPGPVTVHIVPGDDDSYATPGEIWLSPGLLATGVFAWGTVQHEYAHQVDWSLLTDEDRAMFARILGGTGWSLVPGQQHAQANAERFASTLAWSYWPSPSNALMPRTRADEAGGIPPDQFRAVLASMIGARAM